MKKKIVIGGSMTFAKQQIEIKERLKLRGYDVLITDNIQEYANDSTIKNNPEKEIKISNDADIIRNFFDKIKTADVFLICNLEKNGIAGYLGVNALMEIAIAYDRGIRICLLEDIDPSQSYAVEIGIIRPEILNGDLSRI